MGTIRLILAVSVVVSHSNAIFGVSFLGGQVAVQAFYIISGFYIALILKEKYIGANNSYKLFISNRLLRLYPIYWIVLILTILWSATLGIYTDGFNFGPLQFYHDYFYLIDWKTYVFLALSNISIVFQDLVYFMGLDASGGLFLTSNFNETYPALYKFVPVTPAWTIAVEITFYLVAPFLVKRKAAIIGALILISISLRIVLYQNGLNMDPWTYRFFPTELLFFLLGILAYHIYKKINFQKIKKNHLFSVYAFILILTLTYNFIPLPNKSYGYLFIFFLATPFIFQLSKNWKIDRYIGDLSYPVYILHMLIWSVMSVMKLSSNVHAGLILSILTILFSMVLNQFISKRIEKIRQGRLVISN